MKAKREGTGVAELKRQLASGACAPIYVLLGEESYLRETALAAIRRVVLGAEDQETGFNYDLLYGDETDALEVLNRCDTFPAFADRRPVVIRNVGALPARAPASQPPTSNPCAARTRGGPSGISWGPLPARTGETLYGLWEKSLMPANRLSDCSVCWPTNGGRSGRLASNSTAGCRRPD